MTTLSLQTLIRIAGAVFAAPFLAIILIGCAPAIREQAFAEAAPSAQAADPGSPIVLIPARGLDRQFAEEAFTSSVQFLAEKEMPGTRIYHLDPLTRRVSSFTLPSGTGRQRVAHASMRNGLRPLRQAFLETAAGSEAERAMNIPQALQFLATQVVPGQRPRVIFYGNPSRMVSDERFLNSSGSVPTSGWLYDTSGDSPFRLSSADLTGWRIFVVTPTGWFRGDFEADGVQRFLASFCRIHDARLVSMSDAKSVMEFLGSPYEGLDTSPLADDQRRNFVHRVTMNGTRTEQFFATARETPPPTALERGGPPESQISLALRSGTDVRSGDGRVSIIVGYSRAGMRVDLVVIPRPGARAISASNPGSPQDDVYYHEGRTFHGVSYAEVVFKNRPEPGAEAWLNLGSVQDGREPTAGETAIIVDNIRYMRPFDFKVLRGDGGENFASRKNSIFWMRIPLDVIHAK